MIKFSDNKKITKIGQWNYDDSVKKVRQIVYKWGKLTVEIAQEIWIARKEMSSQGKRNDLTLTQMRRSWSQYCIDIGLVKSTANRWLERYDEKKQILLDDKEFKEKKVKQREDKFDKIKQNQSKLPSDIYKILYADPPWKYTEDGLTGVSNNDNYGNVDKFYPQMTTEEICDMEIPKTNDDAVLFLWTTSPFLEKSFRVIHAWGFQYKTNMVWDKIKHNMGYYCSVRHEHLLICTKGSCTPEVKKLFDSVQTIERTEHSVKPEKFREIIDTIYPSGKRIELFAREKSKGWDSWGNQL